MNQQPSGEASEFYCSFIISQNADEAFISLSSSSYHNQSINVITTDEKYASLLVIGQAPDHLSLLNTIRPQ